MRQIVLSIILIASLIAMGYFIYQYLSAQRELEVEVPTEDPRIAEYRKIKTLKPDLSIFADPFFRSLFSPAQTYGVGQVQPAVSPGRQNPFAPF